jgi:hypothetical protein
MTAEGRHGEAGDKATGAGSGRTRGRERRRERARGGELEGELDMEDAFQGEGVSGERSNHTFRARRRRPVERARGCSSLRSWG